MKLRLNTCCCCVSLRQGAIVIGILSIIFGIIGIIIFTTFGDETTKEIHYSTSVLIVVCIGVFVVGAVMILGVKKGKSIFMIPWLVQNGLGIILQVIYTLIKIFSASSGFIIGALIGTGIDAYLWLAVYSCYLSIKEDSRKPAQSIDPVNDV